MADRESISTKLRALVATAEEFDCLTAETLPELLDHAATQTRRFLRDTGQWVEDVGHEKLALRWGYELLERFLACGRSEVPCRPLFLLDSLIAKHFSRPAPIAHHEELASPLGRFLDGLISRSMVSRDALMALFHHCYGYGQGHVVKLLNLDPTQSQRVYKNYERWRRSGWQRTMEEIGLTDVELRELEERKRRRPDAFNAEAGRLVVAMQAHYRKSDPRHFPCLSRQQWTDLFRDDCGFDYRGWHLVLCRTCLEEVYELRRDECTGVPAPDIDMHVRPLQRGGDMVLVVTGAGGRDGNGTERSAPRLSGASS